MPGSRGKGEQYGLHVVCKRVVNTLATTLSGSPQATLKAVPPATAANMAKKTKTTPFTGLDL